MRTPLLVDAGRASVIFGSFGTGIAKLDLEIGLAEVHFLRARVAGIGEGDIVRAGLHSFQRFGTSWQEHDWPIGRAELGGECLAELIADAARLQSIRVEDRCRCSGIEADAQLAARAQDLLRLGWRRLRVDSGEAAKDKGSRQRGDKKSARTDHGVGSRNFWFCYGSFDTVTRAAPSASATIRRIFESYSMPIRRRPVTVPR